MFFAFKRPLRERFKVLQTPALLERQRFDTFHRSGAEMADSSQSASRLTEVR